MTVTTGSAAAGVQDQQDRIFSVSFMRFVLCFTEPGAVTVPARPDHDENAPWGRERAHLVIDTGPRGRPHLPGTSLAGALRDMVSVVGGDGLADELFGHLLPAGAGGAEVDGRASLIWVLGSQLVAADGSELEAVGTEIRASTAICRTRAAAENDTLRVEEVVPAGSRFEVFLRWDNAPAADIERFAGWLAAWQPLIGRGVSRGRGRCAVEPVRHGTLRLDEQDGLLRWLSMSGPALARAVATTEVTAGGGGAAAGTRPLVRVRVRITGPVRVGSGRPPERAGEEGQQVTPMFRVGDRYVLPGTGLKGLLRSRIEYILRSAGAEPRPCLDRRCGQVGGAGRCWPCEVFGHGGGHDPGARSVGARALVRVLDAEVEDPERVIRQHVAIDRFTGGAQEGLLYTAEALESGTFDLVVEPLAAGLDDVRVAEIRALLRLVLEDLDDGLTGIGAGVARGYGSVSVGLAEAEERGDLPGSASARQALRDMAGRRTGAEAGS
jgi:CRISPR/Cas system CSM-associated protein Csm3 (group 7 of RAMP superfamily)